MNGNRAGLDKVRNIEESRAMNQVTNKPNNLHPTISPDALAQLGGGEIAYVRAIKSEDVPTLYPQAPQMAPGMKLFALHAADGTPIMITDSREAAVANAWSNQLETVSVH